AELIQQGLTGSTRRDFGGGVTFAFRNAEDGRSAIALLRDEAFDAAIIDVYLPVVDGPTVIAVARKELGLIDLPIIAGSAARGAGGGGGGAAGGGGGGRAPTFSRERPRRLRGVREPMRGLTPP